MKCKKNYSLNIGGKVISLTKPCVMGILNATPDSFYEGSRTLKSDGQQTQDCIRQRVKQIVCEGATIIDVGAYSSRPGAKDVSAKEEMDRLHTALKICKEEAPDMTLSIDTFRADVARYAIEECGAHIINDISGGEMDHTMFRTVAQLGVPYVLMHMQGTPTTMQQNPQYNHVTRDVITYLSHRIQKMREYGVCDIIADPGFGFGKTMQQNYQMMQQLSGFSELDVPLLVGISRKSMIYKLTGDTPAEALPGTIALNMWALQHGCHILRVHDIKAAVDTVKVFEALQQTNESI